MRLLFAWISLFPLFFGTSVAKVMVEGENLLEVSPEHHQLVDRGVNCKAVTGVVAALKGLGGLATLFCSSYIHIPPTTTLTSTTTGTLSTATMTVTVVVATTTFTTSSIVILPTASKRAVVAERHPHLSARAVPGGLASYAAAEISSACSCLSIKPGKTTTTTLSVPGGSTTTTSTSLVTTTVTTTTCNPSGGPCTLYNNCCGPVCVLISDALPVYTCR